MCKFLSSLLGFFMMTGAYSQVLVYQGNMRGSIVGFGETFPMTMDFYMMRDMANDNIYLSTVWQQNGEKFVQPELIPHQTAASFFDLGPNTADIVVLDGGNRKMESLRLRIGEPSIQIDRPVVRMQGTTQGNQVAQPVRIGTADQSTWSFAPAHVGTIIVEHYYSGDHALGLLNFSTRLHAPLTLRLNQQGLSGEAAANEILSLLADAGYRQDN